MSIDARAFLDAVTDYATQPEGNAPESNDRNVRLGTIDAAYTTGDPKVLFDGETVMGSRTYKAIEAVTAGDRVVLLPVGRTYVILGAIGASGRAPYAQAAGIVATAGSLAVDATLTGTITFPVGRFSVAPLVVIQPTGSGRLATRVFSTSAASTSFSLTNVAPGSAGDTAISWVATQMTPSSAAG